MLKGGHHTSQNGLISKLIIKYLDSLKIHFDQTIWMINMYFLIFYHRYANYHVLSPFLRGNHFFEKMCKIGFRKWEKMYRKKIFSLNKKICGKTMPFVIHFTENINISCIEHFFLIQNVLKIKDVLNPCQMYNVKYLNNC